MSSLLKKGNSGQAVKDLQLKLKRILRLSMYVDGRFGGQTEKAVKDFQKMIGTTQSGIVTTDIMDKINSFYTHMYESSNLLNIGHDRFVVFVDAGHGAINNDGQYVTPGKRAYHEGIQAHKDGHYYEGYENRLAAELFIEQCTKLGITCIRTYHPYKDTSLSERSEMVRSWLRRGYVGYLHSFHSNAISLDNSKDKLESTRGFIVFNTRGNNLSDKIATAHYNNVVEEFGSEWLYRKQMNDGDVDFEANFQILRETDLEEFPKFGAILDEWGFHTSSKDVEFIIKNRHRRAKVCAKTALYVKEKLLNV